MSEQLQPKSSVPVTQVKNSQKKRTGDEPGDPLSNCVDMPKPWASVAVEDAADPDLCIVGGAWVVSVAGSVLAAFSRLLFGTGLKFSAKKFQFPNQID